MITVRKVFDKLGVPQSNHVRSYIGVLVSEQARNMQVIYTTEPEEDYLVNSYPDDFEPEIRKFILDEPKAKRPRIKFKKINGPTD